MQSLHARESKIPTNGDGFGLGWYTPEINASPALFTSIFPAWNDRNLLHLTAKIKAPAFFAHVRAASSAGVSNVNCHPFAHNSFMLMHNGEIQHFALVKRHLRRLLDDDIYNWIQGETDSEHLFALFLQLAKGRHLAKAEHIAEVLEFTFDRIMKLVKDYGKSGTSYFNICITDGKKMVASRYCTNPNITPETLHYSVGAHFTPVDRHFHMIPGDFNGCIIVTSEKLTDFDVEWQTVPANHLLIVEEDLTITLRPILNRAH